MAGGDTCYDIFAGAGGANAVAMAERIGGAFGENAGLEFGNQMARVGGGYMDWGFFVGRCVV